MREPVDGCDDDSFRHTTGISYLGFSNVDLVFSCLIILSTSRVSLVESSPVCSRSKFDRELKLVGGATITSAGLQLLNNLPRSLLLRSMNSDSSGRIS